MEELQRRQEELEYFFAQKWPSSLNPHDPSLLGSLFGRMESHEREISSKLLNGDQDSLSNKDLHCIICHVDPLRREAWEIFKSRESAKKSLDSDEVNEMFRLADDDRVREGMVTLFFGSEDLSELDDWYLKQIVEYFRSPLQGKAAQELLKRAKNPGSEDLSVSTSVYPLITPIICHVKVDYYRNEAIDLFIQHIEDIEPNMLLHFFHDIIEVVDFHRYKKIFHELISRKYFNRDFIIKIIVKARHSHQRDLRLHVWELYKMANPHLSREFLLEMLNDIIDYRRESDRKPLYTLESRD
ncbi:hypothetical protein ACFLZS_01530 [Patescibacteria group bacterium]